MIMIRDKGRGNVSYYVEEAFALNIDFFSTDDAGYIKSWGLKGPSFHIRGNTLDKLIATLDWLVSKYELKFHNSEKSRDLLVIYVKDLNVIRGFLSKYITEDFTFYVQVNDFIEFRPMDIWNDGFTDEFMIWSYADFLIHTIFIPEKYFYITPNQIPRKHIANACKGIDTLAKDIFPDKYYLYTYMKDALFGGFYYMPYKNRLITEPMIALDLVSAYIYCLLIEKHCSTKFVETNPEDFEFFLDSTTKCSIGTYTIKYSTFSNKIKCYKDIFGTPLEKGENEVTVRFTNIDLKIFTSIATVSSIECSSLYEAELDYIPDYIQEVIVDEYIKKQEYKESNDPRTPVQKSTVNGIYGDTIRTIHNEKEFTARKRDACLAPQWGILTTSYCKKLLLSLATQVDGWTLSATDSIYCFDTPKNRELLAKINNEITNKVKNWCDKFEYDYEKLKTLGTFKIEAEIQKFKAFSYGCYAYTKTDGELVIKASGCNKDQLPHDDSIYELYNLPTGTRKLPRFNPETTTCEVDGVVYISEGSYYEYETKSSAETDFNYILTLMGVDI